MAEFSTAGEQLARRGLEKEKRAGVAHYVTGQHAAVREGKEVWLTYVNAMGHVVCVPFDEQDGEWVPVGIYSEAGHSWMSGIRLLPEDFKVSDAMRTAVEVAVA